jgi:uncharacterized damage-inducible protein DinB
VFRRINDFVALWNDEAEATSRVFAALTDASLSQAVTNDHRTIGRMAWHSTQTIPEMLAKTGLTAKGPAENDPVPTSAKAIADAYCMASGSVAGAVADARWTDKTLEETRPMYGEVWTIAFTLRVLVLHQAHHRGELVVLMRQAGLRVPGIYGPAKEDWAMMGMEPPSI